MSSRSERPHFPPDMPDFPNCRILSNEDYRVVLTANGTGISLSGEWTLYRGCEDPIEDTQGYFVYLRDVESGAFWSASARPVQAATEVMTAADPGVVSFSREAARWRSELEVCVLPDAPGELRRLIVRNDAEHAREIEVTSCLETVLDRASAFAAHPLFSKLFIQTEWIENSGLLLARRRPRGNTDSAPVMAHAIVEPGSTSVETSRVRFIGRGRTLASPEALEAKGDLSGTVGSVLDPIASCRRRIVVAPGESVAVTFVLACLPDAAACVRLLTRLREPEAIGRAFSSARLRETSFLAQIGWSEAEAAWAQDLAGRMHFGGEAFDGTENAASRGALEALGLSNSKPFILADLSDATREALRGLMDAVERSVDQMKSRATATKRATRTNAPDFRRAPVVATAESSESPRDAAGETYGSFSDDAREFRIEIRTDASGRWHLPPLPWINVIANERFGCFISEQGSITTWSGNSREHRLTPWHNDPLLDPHGEAFFLRDEDRGVFWSPLPGPAPAGDRYEVFHGFGYTRVVHTSNDIESECTVFVPHADPLQIVKLRLCNRGTERRRLSYLSYRRLVLGTTPTESARQVRFLAPRDRALFATSADGGDFDGAIAFAAPVLPASGAHASSGLASNARANADVHFTTDRARFIGAAGKIASPEAIRAGGTLDDSVEHRGAPCFAHQVSFELAPGESVELGSLFGEGADLAEAQRLLDHYRSMAEVDAALRQTRAYWTDLLAGLQIETPDRELDALVNGWLPYQNLSCRLWARTALYQSGGAFGFRDQLQDSAALVYLDPAIPRRQLLLHAAHQFVEGDVLHWWHPPAGRGIRTRFADDLLWLPLLAAFYVRATGDSAVLLEPVRFLRASAVPDGEDEVYLTPELSGEEADLYEHCCRALDRSLTNGAHGLPLFGTGDWNDGMNRVGRLGRGESVWMGFFLERVLLEFLPHCAERGDRSRVERYAAYREHLHAALDAAWDGDWYRRGYYDDGTPLGSRESDECQIDALVQAWSVLSGVAPPERAARALDSVLERLVDREAGMIRLLDPPFEDTQQDPGYIKGYVRGVRENGGQYTHAALWVIRALAESGRHTLATDLLRRIWPTSHTQSSEQVARYQVEPYAIVADIYGAEPHVGRGGWTWYTGSAGWASRVVLESILGFELREGTALRLTPRLPDGWETYAIRYRLPDRKTRYDIRVRSVGASASAGMGAPTGKDAPANRIRSATLDGHAIPIAGVAVEWPITPDGRAHTVEVELD